jgi:uncharacterized membrane protein YraQ (UPF0718 family)
MLPTQPNLVAMALQVGHYFREIGPFILFGAAAVAAQISMFGKNAGPWTGHRLIAPIAVIPLGFSVMLVSSIRSALLFRTADVPAIDPVAVERGVVRRTIASVEDLVFPFLLSAGIAAAIVVLTPTEPIWTLLSGDGPWRLIVAPLVAGIVKPRGGTEIPLVMAMITKGLDPAGVVAAIAGAGYLHARTPLLGMLHIGFGIAAGAAFWAQGSVL